MPVNITGSRTTSLLTDNDGDGLPDSGDVFLHELIVTNSGDQDATNVVVEETENGLAIDPSSVQIGPIGVDDTISGISGNTPYTFNAAAITGNDIDSDDVTPNLTVTHINGSAIVTGVAIDVGNGTVTGNGDGTFTFRPDAGFEGDVSFTYNSVDEDGVASVAATPATVTLQVGDAVWYVDSTGGSDVTGDGTFENPFASLNPLTSGGSSDTLDDANDTVFVYANGANAYNSGIVLETGQTLRGEGVAADFIVNGITVSSVQADTQIEYSTFGVELNSGNTILGIDLVGEGATGVAIRDNGASVGNLNISDVEVDGIGQIIDIDNGGVLNVTFQSVTSHASSGVGGVIDLDGVTGSFTVSGFTTMDNASGTHNQVGIDIGGTGGTNLVANFAGGTSLNMGPNASAAGINLGTNAGSTNFAGLAVATQTANGFVANGAGTLTITGAGNSVTTTTGQILSLTNTSVGATDVNFNVLSSSGVTTGNAITLNNVDNNDVVISNVSIAGASADGINVNTGSSTNVNINTATINNTTGDGIEINGSTGAFSIVSGNIGNTNDPGGDTVNITGGTGAVTIGANLLKSSAGHIVEVNGHSAGDIDITGSLNASGGASNGILINNSSGSIDFTNATKTLNTGVNNAVTLTSNTASVTFQGGGLDIDTTSGTGISAGTTGVATGGSLSISGSNNSVSATTGHAVVMNGTDIGGGGITLLRVDSGAGSNTGIWLKDAGSGGFTVTGTGSTPASGGLILGKTGADGATATGIGIYLENTHNISLSNIDFGGAMQNFAIRGSNVQNFTLRDSRTSAGLTFGTSNAADEGVISFDNLTGTALFEGNVLAGGFEDIVRITNTTGSLNLTVRDSALDAAIIGLNATATGNDGILVQTSGTSTLTMLVDGVTFEGARGDMVQVNASEGTTQNVTLSNNQFHNAHTNIVSGGGGISVTGGGGTGTGFNVTYAITGNSFRGAEGPAVFLNHLGTVGTVRGTITGNTIGVNDGVASATQATTGSSAGGAGIFVGIEHSATVGALTHAVRIENNYVGDIIAGSGAIQLRANGDPAGAGETRLEATILNNTIEELGTQTLAGIYAQLGGSGGNGDDARMGLNIEDNNIDMGGASTSIAGILFDDVPPAAGTNSAEFYFPGYLGPYDSTGLANFHTGAEGNTITIAGSPAATVVASPSGTFATGANFVLAVPILAAQPAGEDWESALQQAQADWLAAQQQPAGDGGDDSGSGSGDAGGTGGDPVPDGDTGSGGDPEPAPHPVIVDDEVLSQAELDWLVEAAIERWVDAGATAEQVAAMRATDFTVADMAGLYLAASQAGAVSVDSDGAGHGWYLDGTPGDDAEYDGSGTRLTAEAGGPAAGRMDLLTVLMHELGHQVGLDDLYAAAAADELMYGYATLGERRLPEADDLADADLSHVGHEAYVETLPTIATLPEGRAVRIVFTSTVDSYGSEVIGNPFDNYSTISFDQDGGTPVESNHEALAVDSLALGDFVFLDVNKNGVFDSGTDSGIDTVAISLFADADNDNVADGAAIATTTTDGTGAYSFTNLAAGNYIVSIDASNFLGGGALENKTSLTGGADPDDNVDNDDNGVAGAGSLAGAIVSASITLDYNTETVDDGTGQLDINDTLDFGFIQPNQAPTSTNLDVDSVTWTEGDGAVLLDSGSDATIGDLDSTDFDGGSLTVAIGAGFVSGEDSLGIATGAVTLSTGLAAGSEVTVNGSPIGTVSAVSADSIAIDFNGNATPARIGILVQAFNFANSAGDDPTDGDRTIGWTLVDGDGVANGGDDTGTFTTTVDVDPVNDEPVGADNTITIDEDSSHTFAAADFGFADALDGDAFDGVIITTLPTDGTLLLSGGAVIAGQTIAVGDIASLTFTPGAEESGVGYASFTFQVVDNGGTDNGGVDTDQSANTFTFDVTAVNDAPVLDLNGVVAGIDSTIAYTENDAVTAPAPDALLTDVDDINVEGATIAITGGFQAGTDGLFINGLLSGASGAISWDFDGNTGVMTLTGSASLAEYQALLREVDFASTAEAPGASRTISWTVNDGNDDSAVATTTVNITEVNDAPAGTDNTVTASEDDAYTFTAADFGFTDVDGDALAAVTVTTLPGAGQLLLNGLAVTAGDSVAVADIDSGLLTFQPVIDETGDPYASFTFQVQDDGGTADGGADLDASANTITIDVISDNVPAVAQPDAAATDEATVLNGNVFDDNGNGPDTDPDGPALAVEEVNGSAASVGVQIALASGALLTLNADGTYSYDPNGAFDYLGAPGSGAANIPGVDSFTYKLVNGDSATVTVTVTGLDTDDEVIGTGGDDVLLGGAGSDVLTARGGNDRLDGGTGADIMRGSYGDDSFIVDNVGDAVFENTVPAGFDTVYSSVTYTILPNVEALVLTGGSAIDGTGNDGDNILDGNDADNVLDGGGGADIMRGRFGNDTYVVDDVGDQVIEGTATAGTDTVLSSVTFALGQNLENLVLTGLDAIDGFGNGLANSLTGNAAGNRLDGGGGADLMTGGGGNDVYVVDTGADQAVEVAGEGIDTVRSSASYTLGAEVENLILAGFNNVNGTGNGLDNELIGNDAANRLDGGAGADIMRGGGGDDIYIVDSLGDQTIEAEVTGGTDTVRSSVGFALDDRFENLVLTGTGAIGGKGNALNNVITGNGASNTLSGVLGDDTLNGGGGIDNLSGGLGDDTLDGGAGADLMAGGSGNDTYFVDNVGDQAREGTVAAGFDTVFSSVTYTIQGEVDALVLVGGAAIDGTGNIRANEITGNGAGNVLDGGDGADTVRGGLGDDTLLGGNGNDNLFGEAGNDTLSGGRGDDNFHFDSPLDGVANVDHILNFVVGADKIVLDDAVFAGLAAGALDPNAFNLGATATDADDRILYDAATGALYFDADGSGAGAAAIQFAVLDNAPATLSASDFSVI